MRGVDDGSSPVIPKWLLLSLQEWAGSCSSIACLVCLRGPQLKVGSSGGFFVGCNGNDERHDKLFQLIIILDVFVGFNKTWNHNTFCWCFCGMFRCFSYTVHHHHHHRHCKVQLLYSLSLLPSSCTICDLLDCITQGPCIEPGHVPWQACANCMCKWTELRHVHISRFMFNTPSQLWCVPATIITSTNMLTWNRFKLMYPQDESVLYRPSCDQTRWRDFHSIGWYMGLSEQQFYGRLYLELHFQDPVKHVRFALENHSYR